MSDAPTSRRRRWPLVLVTLAVLAAGTLVLLGQAIDSVGVLPLSLRVDGEEVLHDLDLSALEPAQRLALASGLLLVALTLAVAVPLAVLITVGAALLLALLPLAAVAAAIALVLSPLALIAWLLWRALRPSPTMRP
ncbi:MAG TPA: hypothetical protein PKA84_10425 [Rubrivivax sp.]|jgi:hypothetical protein|nr:hypothetical protein [Rhodoferax sp.]MCP5289369.1 hypothetical protein [Burkholderiaceae bacterium]HMQ70885.1 hypothetical protein [Rubrivivax sp.]HMR70634.1 hypothetical protein [Rubrivivax sp.]